MANDIGGVWRTIGGRHIFIKDGQSLSSAMKKSGKFKNAKKKKNDDDYELSEKDKAEMEILQNIKKLTDIEKADNETSIDSSESDPRKAIKYYLEKGEFEQAEKYMKEYGLEDERELFAEGLNYGAQSDYDKYLKSNANKEKSTSKNEFTREELKSKYGTDNTDVINAGKEKGDRVALKSEKSTNDIMNEKIRSGKSTSSLDKSTSALNKIDKIAGDDEKLQRLGREMGANSLSRWNKAFQEYKREHPKTKLDLYTFIKMNN